jgi:hypothetical protein
MEQSPSLEADRSSASQETICTLWTMSITEKYGGTYPNYIGLQEMKTGDIPLTGIGLKKSSQNSNIHYCILKSSPTVPILSHLNPVQTLPNYFYDPF